MCTTTRGSDLRGLPESQEPKLSEEPGPGKVVRIPRAPARPRDPKRAPFCWRLPELNYIILYYIVLYCDILLLILLTYQSFPLVEHNSSPANFLGK